MTRFEDARTVEELIGQLVGACSTTRFWDEMPPDYPSGAGTFLDRDARSLADEALERYRRLQGGCPAVLNIAGIRYPCETTPWPHPGLAHSNVKAEAIWIDGAESGDSR
jgi:hypothetical protein